jgi:predicted ArsR family transcriptional regulator
MIVNPTEKTIFAVLKESAEISNDEIAALCNVSPRTVIRVVQELERLGHIAVQRQRALGRGRGKRPNRYEVLHE